MAAFDASHSGGRTSSRISQMSQITDRLYLSGVRAVTQQNLRLRNIAYVFNITIEAPNVCCVGVHTFRVPVNDVHGENIGMFFDSIADQINDLTANNYNVLVHCVAGVSRSASFVLAYLMKHLKFTLRDAFRFLHSKRPVVRPNSSFFRQLIDYELMLHGRNTVVMTTITSFDERPIEVPDIYVNEYKKMALLEIVIRRRHKLREQAEVRQMMQECGHSGYVPR